MSSLFRSLFLLIRETQVSISIPVITDDNKKVNIDLIFEFLSDPSVLPRFDVTFNNNVFTYQLKNFVGDLTTGTVEPSRITIAGYIYDVHFMGTGAHGGHMIQFSVSVYRVGPNA